MTYNSQTQKRDQGTEWRGLRKFFSSRLNGSWQFPTSNRKENKRVIPRSDIVNLALSHSLTTSPSLSIFLPLSRQTLRLHYYQPSFSARRNPKSRARVRRRTTVKPPANNACWHKWMKTKVLSQMVNVWHANSAKDLFLLSSIESQLRDQIARGLRILRVWVLRR